jgi:hypothetical protein
MAQKTEPTTVDLDPGEVALVVSEDDGALAVRVVAAADVDTEGDELEGAPEIVVALAMRLLKDPDFRDDVLDWYYEHRHDADEADEAEG